MVLPRLGDAAPRAKLAPGRRQGFVAIALAVRGLAAEPSFFYRLPTILPLGRWPLLRSTVANWAK